VGASAFLKDHCSELLANFLSPVPVAELPAPEQTPPEHALLERSSKHVAHIKAKLSPILNESVSTIEALIDGRVYIVVKDWAACKLFKAEYQALTSTEYYSHSTEIKGGLTVKRFNCRWIRVCYLQFSLGLVLITNASPPCACRRAGKTPWDAAKDKSSESGMSIKGTGCSASMVATLHPDYAREMKVGNPTSHNDTKHSYSTTVAMYITSEHTGHDPNEDRDVNMLKVDDRVRSKIMKLAESRSLSVAYITTQVHAFADGLVGSIKGSSQFYPTMSAITKIVKQHRETLRLDPHDHLAVEKYIDQDKAANPKNLWFFRAGNGPQGTQPMLLVHQTPFQQEMMAKYGGTIVGMDATYKTNLWGLPLVLIVIADNHGHGYPIACAFIQREEQGQLAEVLLQLRNWNPTFNPKFFSIDKSQPEINAIQNTFPHSRILLCDFHRQQSWQRWIHGSDVKKEYKDDLFEKMRLVGYAGSVPDFKSAMFNLQACPGWIKSNTIKGYWDNHWGNCTDLWASCYRQVCLPPPPCAGALTVLQVLAEEIV
jgi:hypothetical protein